MPRTNSLLEYQSFVAESLRAHELNKAAGNPEKLREISELSDTDLLRKWFLLSSLVGFPVFYIVVPLILSLLQTFVWVWIMHFLWLVAKGAMGLVFIVFMLAIYFTTRKDTSQE